ncbi:hypothetical protein C0J52_14823 [Blattella germanica]|nr:hypothetical protein C0J52_14823 [Blattella germanica]
MDKINLTECEDDHGSDLEKFKGNENEKDMKCEVEIILERCNTSGNYSIQNARKLFQQKRKCCSKGASASVKIEDKHKGSSASKRKSCNNSAGCNEGCAMLLGPSKKRFFKHKKSDGYLPLKKQKHISSEKAKCEINFSLVELMLKEKCELANNPKVLDFLRTVHQEPFVDVQDANENVSSWDDIYRLCSSQKVPNSSPATNIDGIDECDFFKNGNNNDTQKNKELNSNSDISFSMKVNSTAQSEKGNNYFSLKTGSESVPTLEKRTVEEKSVNEEKINLENCSEEDEELINNAHNVSQISAAFSAMNVKIEHNVSLSENGCSPKLHVEETNDGECDSTETLQAQINESNKGREGSLTNSLYYLIMKFASIMNISQSENFHSPEILLYGKSDYYLQNKSERDSMLPEHVFAHNESSLLTEGNKEREDEDFMSTKSIEAANSLKDNADDNSSRSLITELQVEEDDSLSLYKELPMDNEKPTNDSPISNFEALDHSTASEKKERLIKIPTLFKNICFQYLEKKVCKKKYCIFVHEMPDIHMLNGEFEEEILYAKRCGFFYFLNYTYEVLMKDTCKNQTKGMWEKVMLISEMCGISPEQFTKQISNYIGKCFYINSISVYELLLVLLDKNLLECSWELIRVLPDLNYDMFPDELVRRFIEIINTKTCSEAICRKLYQNMFVHVPSSCLKKIRSFEFKTFLLNLECFGLYEEAQFLRSQFDNEAALLPLGSNSSKNVLQTIPDLIQTGDNLDKESNPKNTNVWCEKLENLPQDKDENCFTLKRSPLLGSNLSSSFEDSEGKYQNIWNKELGNSPIQNNYHSMLRKRNISQSFFRKSTSDTIEIINNDVSQESSNLSHGNSNDLEYFENEDGGDVDDDSGLGESACAYQRDQHSSCKSQKRKDEFVKMGFKRPRSITSSNCFATQRLKNADLRQNPKIKWERVSRLAFHENQRKFRNVSACNSEIVSGCLKPWYFTSRTYRMRSHMSRGPMNNAESPHLRNSEAKQRNGGSWQEDLKPRQFIRKWPWSACYALEFLHQSSQDDSCSNFQEIPSWHFHSDRSINMILQIFNAVKNDKGSIASALQVYGILKLDLQTSIKTFTFLVQDSAQCGLRPPLNIEKFLSTVGTNLMLDHMALCHWKRAYEMFSIMRSGLIDIRLSEIYRDELFSPCCKILWCVEVCLQIGATEEALNILKYNRMLSPNILNWKLSCLQQDFQEWLKLCTILLHQFVLEGPMVLAQWLFLELLKAQGNLFQSIELSALSNLLMVKLLNEDYIEEALQLYHHIKPDFDVLASHTHRALLIALICNNRMEMARSVFESCVLLNIYPRMKVSGLS